MCCKDDALFSEILDSPEHSLNPVGNFNFAKNVIQMGFNGMGADTEGL